MSRVLATLKLQDDMLKQTMARIKELEHDLAYAHGHIQFLEAKLMKLTQRAKFDDNNLSMLLKRQAG